MNICYTMFSILEEVWPCIEKNELLKNVKKKQIS